jgi:hypothetical protein
MLSRGIVFVILSKNEEHHYLVLKMKNPMKIMLKSPRFWTYLQKRKEYHFLGLKIKKSNKKMPKTLGFWVYLQKKKTLYFRVITRSKPMFSTTFLPLHQSLRITTKK